MQLRNRRAESLGRDEGRMGKAVEQKDFAGLSPGKVGGLIFAEMRIKIAKKLLKDLGSCKGNRDE